MWCVKNQYEASHDMSLCSMIDAKLLHLFILSNFIKLKSSINYSCGHVGREGS